MDVEAPQAFEADGEHDVVAWNGVPDDQSLEDERDAPVSGLITSGSLEHSAELLDSAHILPKSLNVASAEPHCDLDSEDALSLTDSMVPSSIDTCSSLTADWPEDTAGNLSSHIDDALTVTVDTSTLTAASGIASHPLLLTNRSSVSPDVYIPRAEHVTTSGSCHDSEMRMSDWESVADAACTDAGIASVTDCVAGQVSSLVPDENDRLVSGRRILGNRYVVEKVVGEGAYGIVMKCHLLHDQAQHVAVKIFKIVESDADAEDVKRTARREAALLKRLHHQNITSLIDTFLIKDKLCICMEFSPCTLLEFLEATNNGNGLDPDLVKRIIYQTLCAITFLHSKDIVFRDVKPENILIDANINVKLCDFGFARQLPPDSAVPGGTLTDYVATRWYRAPELLLSGTYQQHCCKLRPAYGKPVDVWSVGCLMAELLTGQPLFPGESDLDQLYKIVSLVGPLTADHLLRFQSHPSNANVTFRIKSHTTLRSQFAGQVPEDAVSFMEGLLHMDPAKRLCGNEFFMHPYLHCMGREEGPCPGDNSDPLRFLPATAPSH